MGPGVLLAPIEAGERPFVGGLAGHLVTRRRAVGASSSVRVSEHCGLVRSPSGSAGMPQAAPVCVASSAEVGLAWRRALLAVVRANTHCLICSIALLPDSSCLRQLSIVKMVEVDEFDSWLVRNDWPPGSRFTRRFGAAS
jgi:hypothetical protein